MKILSLIVGLVLVMSGCVGIQFQGTTDIVTDAIAFNVGCVGATELPKVFEPSAVIVRQGLVAVDEGQLSLNDVVEELTAVLDIETTNEILQANLKRFIGGITIIIDQDVAPEKLAYVRTALQAFIDGVESCR